MEYRRLGKSGLKVSEFSYGSWVTFAKQVDVAPAKEMLTAAYDAGINFFDNAEGYEQGKSELVMGQAIEELGWSRDSYIVSSKVFWGGTKPTQKGLSAKHVTEACHMALKRLRVDHLDLYFCHRPDVDTPIVETVRAMIVARVAAVPIPAISFSLAFTFGSVTNWCALSIASRSVIEVKRLGALVFFDSSSTRTA